MSAYSEQLFNEAKKEIHTLIKDFKVGSERLKPLFDKIKELEYGYDKIEKRLDNIITEKIIQDISDNTVEFKLGLGDISFQTDVIEYEIKLTQFIENTLR